MLSKERHQTATGPDSHALMMNLLGEAEAHGLTTLLRARSVINAAGSWSEQEVRGAEGLPPSPQLELVKGSYFALNKRAPFSRLIYPTPTDGGLGVHLTIDLAGRAMLALILNGLMKAIDYAVDCGLCTEFGKAISRYWEAVQADDLSPDYSGVRRKLLDRSFRISKSSDPIRGYRNNNLLMQNFAALLRQPQISWVRPVRSIGRWQAARHPK